MGGDEVPFALSVFISIEIVDMINYLYINPFCFSISWFFQFCVDEQINPFSYILYFQLEKIVMVKLKRKDGWSRRPKSYIKNVFYSVEASSTGPFIYELIFDNHIFQQN